MPRRQTMPQQWLIIPGPLLAETFAIVRRLPRGSGILLLTRVPRNQRRQLRQLASLRRLVMVTEGRHDAARVHDVRELGAALLARTPIILLSPLYPTASHPDWRAIPRMRAAALARLSRRRLFALGGMNRTRYAKVARLGFLGWAGISAFRT